MRSVGILIMLLFLVACSSSTEDAAAPGEDTPTWPQMDIDGQPDTTTHTDSLPDTPAPADTSPDTAPDITTATDFSDPGCQTGCFGDPCSVDADCESGYCTEHLGTLICSKLCETDCPAGWACTQDGDALPELVYYCLSRQAHLCRPCVSDADCANGPLQMRCLNYGDDGSFCGAPCDEADGCPEGYTCKTALTMDDEQLDQCLPDTGKCACTPLWAEEAAWTPCHNTSDFGVCDGARTCLLQGLTACDAGTAGAEVCDGADNDCDEEVDEGEALCDDEDPCTVDSCNGFQGCTNAPLAECCLQDSDCDDSSPCTADACVENQCQNEPIPGCCVFDADCDDDDPCTEDDSEGNICTNTPVPDCCEQNSDCDDDDPCTEDVCEDNVCVNTPIPNCCAFDADCDDDDVCTEDDCDGGQCSNDLIPGCCVLNSDCEDGNPCTKDTCVDNQCTSSPVPDCCNTDDQCDDDNPCTLDDCVNGDCLYALVPDCCSDDEDCDDDIPCTLDECLDNTCINTPDAGCCADDADCEDGDPCTADICQNGVCKFLSGGNCVTLNPVEDTWLEGSSNKGGYDFLIIGKTSTYEKKRSLLRFDLASIPAGAEIQSAELRLYYYYSSKPSGITEACIDRTVMVHKMLIPWSETQATKFKATNTKNWSESWVGINDVDAEMQPLDDDLWVCGQYEWKPFDVTPAAQSWQQTPAANYGLLVWATNEDTPGRDMRIYSREKSDTNLRPQLVIVYSAP